MGNDTMDSAPIRCPYCGAYDVDVSERTCTCTYCGTSFCTPNGVAAPVEKREQLPLLVCPSCNTSYKEEEWAQCCEASIRERDTTAAPSWTVSVTAYACPTCGGTICRECVVHGRFKKDTCRRCKGKVTRDDGYFVVRSKKEIPFMLRRYIRSKREND